MFYTSFLLVFFFLSFFAVLIDIASEMSFTAISLIGKEAGIKKSQKKALKLILLVSVWLYCSFSVQNHVYYSFFYILENIEQQRKEKKRLLLSKFAQLLFA